MARHRAPHACENNLFLAGGWGQNRKSRRDLGAQVGSRSPATSTPPVRRLVPCRRGSKPEVGNRENQAPLRATEQASAEYARLLLRCRAKGKADPRAIRTSSGDAFSALATPPAPSPRRWRCVNRQAIPMPPDSYPRPVRVRPPGEARQNRPRGRPAVSRLRP
jgi:hypothetical protein